MGQAKIQFAVGGLSFSGEGEREWLAQQLHDVLEAAPRLAKIESQTPVGEPDTTAPHSDPPEVPFTQPLASHIREKGGDSSQQKRFLATADWLRRRGSTDHKTAAVTKALQDNHQKRLSNPADCLNKNVARGFCEKEGDGFFITPDGLRDLGYQ